MNCQITNISRLRSGNTFISFINGLIVKTIWQAKKLLLYLYKSNIKFRPRKGIIRENSGIIKTGDTVLIRTKSEITLALDNYGGTKGCIFLREMFDHCGKKYKIYKVVNHFFDETKDRIVRCRNIVILEDVYCSGERRLLKHPCDRNCFMFWHQDWMEKV